MSNQHRITISLPPEVAEWLNKNIKNKSAYIAHLIRQDAKIKPSFKKKETKK